MKNKFTTMTVALHWLVATAMIGLTAAGLYMATFEVWFLYPIHKSIGVLVFGIVLVRVLWRMKEGWPEPVSDYSRFEHLLAKLVHWVLLIATIMMPVSGMVYSGASGHGFGIFGLEIVATNLNSDGNVVPYNETWYKIGDAVHEYLGYLVVATVILHVVGALKHHFIDKDATLKRMLGKSLS